MSSKLAESFVAGRASARASLRFVSLITQLD